MEKANADFEANKEFWSFVGRRTKGGVEALRNDSGVKQIECFTESLSASRVV